MIFYTTQIDTLEEEISGLENVLLNSENFYNSLKKTLKRTTTNSPGKKNKHSTTNSNYKVLDSKPAAALKTNSHLKRKFKKKTLPKKIQ